jgi:nicotinamidase-related amidase
MSLLADPSTTLLLVVDIQEKFIPHIHEAERVVSGSVRMLRAANVLGLPVIVTEQYRKGLGTTVPQVLEAAASASVIEKMTFSCLGSESVRQAIDEAGARTVLLVGIEAHVCILQTAMDLLDLGLRPQVVADAVSSRRESDMLAALERMRQAGVVIATSEMTILELVRDASLPAFKAVLPLIK